MASRSDSSSGVFTIFILVIILTLFVYNNTKPKPTKIIAGVNTINGQDTSQFVARGVLPNPELTPGDVLNSTTEEICVPGYAGNNRNVSTALKKEVYKAYNVPYPQPTGSIEVDHLISLQLGGSNDFKNLWPQKESANPGFREKDKVETYLHKQLCSGQKSLQEVQSVIAKDWTVAYREYLSIKR
jgi:hypothetical protein